MNDLAKIQSEIKVPKGQFNKFGNYKYRSCEDIVEAAKPILNKYGFYLVLTDEIVNIGGRNYIKASAIISRMQSEIAVSPEIYSTTAYAREEETKKGMDAAQITGAASSYARKYALNGLFAIDDTKDPDATNTHDEPIHTEAVNNELQNFNNLMDGEPANHDLPWLNEGTKEFEGAVEKMKAGKSSVKALRKYFKISKKVEAKLNEYAG